MVHVEAHSTSQRGKITVAVCAPGWIAGQELLEMNSVGIAKSALNRIMPHLGGQAREDATPDDVRRMLAALKKSGLSDGTVSRTLDVARQLLPKAATEGVRYRIKERRRMQIATRNQAAAIESAIDARYSLLVRKAFMTGARWGELVARHPWDRHREARSRLRRQDPKDDRGSRDGVHRARGYGKTAAAVRAISVPEDLALELAAYRKELCFTGPRGGYLKRSTFRRVYWLLAIEKAGVQGMRVHDMRHSAISWWAAARIPLADVRDRAGHSSIAVTNTYVHAVPGDDDPFFSVFAEAA